MTNLEKLRTSTPEQIRDMFCEKYGDCFYVCPRFLFDRCKNGKNGVLEWLNDEAIAPKDAQKKEWMKLKEELCNEIGDCDKCPSPISKHCEDARKNIKTGSKAPNDVPQGWIRLITIKGDIYMNASKIVSLGVPDPATASDGVATVVYTVGAEDDPWYVCDSIETVMEKIKRA